MSTGRHDANHARREYQRQAREKIRESGWITTNAFHADQHGVQRPFLFTIGLYACALPELVVYGLDIAVSHKILNHAARRSLSQQPEIGARWVLEDFNSDLTFTFAPVSPAWAKVHMGRVRLAHPKWKPGDGSVLQLLYPDVNGRFPGDPFYAIDPHVQPLLCDSDENFIIPATLRAGPWTFGDTLGGDTDKPPQ